MGTTGKPTNDGRIVVPDVCLEWLKLQRPGGRGYAEETEDDFKSIEPHLPESVDSILDIGCGMAGIDVYLKRKFPRAKLYLLDGYGNSPGYGFNTSSKPYSSRDAAEALLKANGVSVDKWFDVDTQEELMADLIVSLISWGFHYPLSTYNVKGYCIADIRTTHELKRGQVIYSALKYKRCAFRC